MKLIDKDALVEEIDKVIDESAPSHDQQCPWEDGYYCGLYKAESIIDTLEVKEVDLEEKATQLALKYFPNEENIWARENWEACRCKSACIEMAEWLKVQKGEEL